MTNFFHANFFIDESAARMISIFHSQPLRPLRGPRENMHEKTHPPTATTIHDPARASRRNRAWLLPLFFFGLIFTATASLTRAEQTPRVCTAAAITHCETRSIIHAAQDDEEMNGKPGKKTKDSRKAGKPFKKAVKKFRKHTLSTGHFTSAISNPPPPVGTRSALKPFAGSRCKIRQGGTFDWFEWFY